MPDRLGSFMKGAQTATNTKHRERRSMAEETPASAGDNGADAVPATPHNHSPHAVPSLSRHCATVYVHYYLPRKNSTQRSLLLVPAIRYTF